VPSLFPAVEVDGDLYWDGLYSQNPPLRELLDTEPDELWIIQIDPAKRSEVPRRPAAIRDRRNELTANLSVQRRPSSSPRSTSYRGRDAVRQGHAQVPPCRDPLPHDEREQAPIAAPFR
jgi:predicted acylesterase/phospholipase RssA